MDPLTNLRNPFSILVNNSDIDDAVHLNLNNKFLNVNVKQEKSGHTAFKLCRSSFYL